MTAAAAASAPSRPAFLRAALVLLAATVLIVVASRWRDDPAPVNFGYGPRDFGEALRLADDRVALTSEHVRRYPGEWSWQESAARALLGRARLTGSFDDLAAARGLLARAMAEASWPAGPVLTDAVANMTIHRLAPVPADLARQAAWAVPAPPGDRAEAAAIRGDVAFYSGDYAGAARGYDRAARIDDSDGGVAVRRGNLLKKLGRFDEARAQFALALRTTRSPTRQFAANMLVQQGTVELARGDHDAAETLFRAADATFPGSWITQAHVAQMLAVRGDLRGAIGRYRAIVARAGPGLAPEVMDALAGLYRAEGDAAASRAWAARAGAIWDRRLKLLPEAAYGHALEHELTSGDPVRALDLARRNLAARPYGVSATMLGWALLANGRAAEAAATIAAVNRSGWRTAQQYVLLSEAEAMLGHADPSEAARRTAISINPRAFDASASLIRFGNH